MTRRRLYRLVAFLSLVMAIGHTVAFLDQSSLSPAAAAARVAMFDARFPMLGSEVSLGSLYLGFGWVVTVAFLFSSVVAWSLGEFEATAARTGRPIAWALAATMFATSVFAFAYMVVPPVVLGFVSGLVVVWAEQRPVA